MASMSLTLYQTSPRRGGVGFSLVECLIANGLLLIMISALVSASVDVVVAARFSAERSDQTLRLRQLRHYLDMTLATARMPPQWLSYQVTGPAPVSWQTPAAPCESPASVAPLEQWGGADLIDLDDVACVPGVSTGQGLYVERILACPMHCEPGPGYRVAPVQCHVEQTDGAVSGGPWRVDWQRDLSPPEGCPEGTAWGRLERLIISHRAASHSGSSVSELRIQSLTQGPAYGWGSAETLVAGITGWQMTQINGLPAARAGSSETEKTHSSVEEGVPPGSYFQLDFSIGPLEIESVAPPLRVSQLLLPRG